jgi:hypothetical protein
VPHPRSVAVGVAVQYLSNRRLVGKSSERRNHNSGRGAVTTSNRSSRSFDQNRWGVLPTDHPIGSGLRFVLFSFTLPPHPEVECVDARKEREIIRLWNQLRLLEREGRPTTVVRRQIEKALDAA